MINPFIYFWIFLKGSLFSSGGLSNLPSVHSDLLHAHWAKETQIGQSVAIGQISPGPNGLWVISIGYLTYGFLGAFLALLAITIPPLLILLVSATYSRIEHQRWVPAFMRGITLAVAGIQITASWSVMKSSGTDWKTWAIAVAAIGLILTKKIPILLIVALAGIVGFLIYH
ncbi:MAG TPA: chromate transporter [Ktedonobacteraceae bacterium]|jgi:chromate transporter|nr:chromate transporter [Ktedonobacteraceae bacterium]